MRKIFPWVVLFLYLLITVVIFRPYFFEKLVPFPANLLVSHYSPWKDYDWEGYPNGPPNKPIGFDNLRYFYPYLEVSLQELSQGRLPLWNPYNFSGNVHIAAYQPAVFYPLNILYYILPRIDAWSILVLIQPLLAGFFMYLFLGCLLSRTASFFGGLVFGLSGWMLVLSEETLVLGHAAIWLPLILYSLEKLRQKASPSNLFLLAASIACTVLAGFLQTTIYVAAAALSWIIFRLKQKSRNRRWPVHLVLVLLLVMLICAVQIWPAVQSYFLSPRGAVDAKFLFDGYLMPPWHLATFLVPDFWGNPGSYNYFGSGFYYEKVIYLGIPAFLLAFLALVTPVKNRQLSFFRYFGLITLALGFFPAGWLLYYSHLPLVSTMIPSRIFFLSTFAFSVLAAFGLDIYLKEQSVPKRLRWPLLFSLVTLISLWLAVIFGKNLFPGAAFIKVATRNLIFSTVVCTATWFLFFLPKYSQRLSKKTAAFGLVLISLFCSFYFANKYLYFSERRFVFPEVPVISQLKKIAGINRIWGYGNGYLEKSLNAYYGLYSVEGYDALFPARYGQLLYAQNTAGKLSSQISRSDAQLKFASERDALFDDPYRRRLMSLLGVKYVLESKTGEGKNWQQSSVRFPPNGFRPAWEDDRYRIWENKEALPRAFLVTEYLVETDPQKIVDQVFNPDFPLGEMVVLEKEPEIAIDQRQPARTDVEIISYQPSRVEIITQSPVNTLLFLSDNYYPGWQVRIDQAPTEILRADFSFRAVAVPEGRHRLVFTFVPAVFTQALLASALGATLFVGWLVIAKIKT